MWIKGFLLLLLLLESNLYAQQAVELAEAMFYVGSKVTIEGRVAKVDTNDERVIFTFGNQEYPQLQVFVFSDFFHILPLWPEEYFLNRDVRIIGKIQVKRGIPVVVARQQYQLQVIESGSSP